MEHAAPQNADGNASVKTGTRFDDVCPLILAAGKGKRMGNGEVPKVMCTLHRKALIEHLLDHVESSRLTVKPHVVVGYGAHFVREKLGDRVNYIVQEAQLGTGHAVRCARSALEGKCGHILVLNGDHPYVPAYVLNEFVSIHKGREATVTITTTIVPDFEAWRKDLFVYGRIVRNVAGEIQRIVEFKDATEEEKKIRELNVGYYCFDAGWLWPNLELVSNKNAQEEFYVTDLVQIAIAQKKKVTFFTIDPIVSIGVNTAEQLTQAQKLLFGES